MAAPKAASAPPQTAAAPACAHCGLPCAPVDIEQQGNHFCCQGCATVHTLLHENGLESFYRLENRTGVRGGAGSASRYRYLDEAETFQRLTRYATTTHALVEFQVPAIHCVACLWLLERLDRLLPGVESAEVNFPKKRVAIRFQRASTSLAEIVALLHRIGYAPRLNLDATDGPKARLSSEAKWLLYRLGVAGFVAGNVMLLSFPEYLTNRGIAPTFRTLFGYLSLALTVPMVFFSGAPILYAAWKGLQLGRLNLDVPLALGILAMLVRSGVEILTESGSGYLDSLAGLVFLLLVGRFLQQRTYDFLSFERSYRSYFPLAVRVLKETGPEDIPVEKLKPGDALELRHGELVPADSTLLSDYASLDLSFLNGESAPVDVEAQAAVPAGSRHLGKAARYRVVRSTAQSELTQLWNHPAFRKQAAPARQAQADRIGRYFTFGVLSVAFGALLVWGVGIGNWAAAWQAFTAVLIVACPCALAFAVPFTYGHLQRQMGRSGLYLKNAAVVEALSTADSIVVDKTGTLTDPNTHQVEFLPASPADELPPNLRAAVAAVAAQSIHPLSRALADGANGSAVTDFEEVPGAGTAGVVHGNQIRLGSAAWVGTSTPVNVPVGAAVHVLANERYWGAFAIRPALRACTPTVLEALQDSYPLSLVSGDAPNTEPALAPWFTPESNAFYRQSPADKLVYVEKLHSAGRKPIMLGDGLNDAGALRAAHVGISLTENTANFTPAADAILSAAALPKLPALLALARSSKRILAACFALSIAYNLGGSVAAVIGWVNPLVAAILMPASSIAVVTLATALSVTAAKRLKINN